MLTARLSLMMFLELFIWGTYFVSMGIFLGAEAAPLVESGAMTTDAVTALKANAYTAIPLGAVVAPLFLGLLADRVLPAQIVLGLLHLIGGGLLFLLPSMPLAGSLPVSPFVLLLAVYAICYMPTLGLTNTVAFHAITQSGGDSQRQFPIVRVFGTIGWIVAGYLVAGAIVPGFKVDLSAGQFHLAGAASILLGLFSFTLPHTPPAMKGKQATIGSLLGFDAIALMKERSFAVFMIASLLLSIPLAFYYQKLGDYQAAVAPIAADYSEDAHAATAPVGADGDPVPYAEALADRTVFARPTATGAWGQISEIGFMLLIPVFFAVLGTKWMLLIGMLAWVLRYILFGYAFDDGITWMVVIGILLHGICYDFFFVTGQIYVDKATPAAVRGQAQGLLVLLTQGVGMIIGAQLAGLLATRTGLDGATPDWTTFWYIPAGFAIVVAIGFGLMFSESDRTVESADEAPVDETAIPAAEPVL